MARAAGILVGLGTNACQYRSHRARSRHTLACVAAIRSIGVARTGADADEAWSADVRKLL